jgi:WD40 repeat protein
VITADGYGPFGSAALSPDGRTVACWSGKNCLHLLDVEKGKEFFQSPPQEVIPSDVIFSADSRRILCREKKAFSVWDASTGKMLGSWEDPAYASSIAISATGEYLALSCFHSKTLRIVNARTGEQLRRLEILNPSK